MLCLQVLFASVQADTAVIHLLTKDMYRLYPNGDSAQGFMQTTDRLMAAAQKAGDDDLYWRTWSNQATYASRHISRERAMEITKAMTRYAKEHDSKLGLYTSTYTNATLASSMRMERQADGEALNVALQKQREAAEEN